MHRLIKELPPVETLGELKKALDSLDDFPDDTPLHIMCEERAVLKVWEGCDNPEDRYIEIDWP